MLQKGSPVHWAVSRSLLQERSPRSILDVEPLGFIYKPLRHLFGDQRKGLTRILKQLPVLEARFQRRYMCEENIDWIQPFDTDTHFFDCILTASPEELADSLTDEDLAAFLLPPPQSIIDEASDFQYVNRRVDGLRRAVQEIIAAESGLVSFLVNLAKEIISTDNALRISLLTATLAIIYQTQFLQPVGGTSSFTRNQLQRN